MRYGRDVRLTQAMVDDATDGYSPCPEPLVEILKTWVAPSANGGTLFDNCAGDGTTANSLARAWGLRPVLVEPHPGRHALCLRYDCDAVRAPAQHVLGRGPTVWFFNPPYDLADETGSMERHLLWSAVTRVPAPLTLCVWLLPRRMLDDPFVPELVEKHLNATRAFRFPAAWEDFQQIAIMGYWTDRADYRAVANVSESDILLGDLPPLNVADTPYLLEAVGADFRASAQSLSARSGAVYGNPGTQSLAKGAI